MRHTSGSMQRSHIGIVLTILVANAFLVRRLLNFHGRRKFRLLAELLAKEVEANRDRDTYSSNAAKKRTSPLDAQTIKHLSGEQGEASCQA